MDRKEFELNSTRVVGYYMENFSNVLTHPDGFHRHRYPNGAVRKVRTDRHGRSGAVMWELPNSQ